MTNYQAHATQLEQQYGLPAGLLHAVIQQESGWNPSAGSPAGAQGLAQLMPATAAGLGVNINDPLDNMRGGAMYLAQQLKAFGGNVRYALAAYNAGPGAVRQYNGIPPYAETQNYLKKVLGYWDRGGSAATGLPGASGSMVQTSPGVAGPSNSWIAKMNAYYMDAPELGAQLINNRIDKAKPPTFEYQPGTGTAGAPGPGGFDWKFGRGEAGSYKDLLRWGAQYGAGATSTVRPGDDGYHGSSRAVDFGTSTTSREEMEAMYAYAMAHPGEFTEFYVPSFIGNQHIEDGRVVNGVYPDHEDHIHAAREAQMGAKTPLSPVTPLTPQNQLLPSPLSGQSKPVSRPIVPTNKPIARPPVMSGFRPTRKLR